MRLVFLMALVWPSSASAGPPPGPPPPPPPLARVVAEHADELDLDAAARERIVAVDVASRNALRALHDDVRAAHDALRDAMEADEPDPHAVFAASAQLGDAETALRDHHLQTDLAVVAELTPAQWASLRAQRPPRPPRR